MGSKLFNYDIFSETQDELIEKVFSMNKVNIVSGNPEILNLGLHDEKILSLFNDEKSIIIPDGIGTVIASKIVKNPVKEKIAGVEVMEKIVKKCSLTNRSIYLLGASQEVVDKCEDVLKIKYPGINVCGKHNGYFDMENCEDIVKDIEEKNPYALFIAMGAPRQELFIMKYINRLPCSIYMGVGGSFDTISGKTKRAPKWMINCGMEWVYRTIKDPKRISRLVVIPKFLFKVIKEK